MGNSDNISHPFEEQQKSGQSEAQPKEAGILDRMYERILSPKSSKMSDAVQAERQIACQSEDSNVRNTPGRRHLVAALNYDLAGTKEVPGPFPKPKSMVPSINDRSNRVLSVACNSPRPAHQTPEDGEVFKTFSERVNFSLPSGPYPSTTGRGRVY